MLNLVANGTSGYNLTNSLRFRSSASASLTRTPASAGNRQTFTWSGWIKRGAGITSATEQVLFGARVGSTNTYDFLCLPTGDVSSADQLSFISRDATTGFLAQLITTQVFRDPSAWYHIVLAVDTTQATAANRIKLYVNGSQVTAFSTATYPAQNTNLTIDTANPHGIFARPTSNFFFDGYLAEVNFIDGQAITPSSFGSTNALTGVWQPAKYTGTYGTNGFYLPFQTTSTTSASFSSYYGTFDNSAKYLSLAGNTAFAFGTGDFCVEAFVTFNSPSTTEQCIATMATSAAGDTAWDFNVMNGTLYFGGWTTVISGAFNVPSGFCHLVACRASGVLSIYANGIRIATGSHTLNYTNTSNTLTIGRRVSTNALNGRISNFRIVKGSSVYTPSSSTLTVPTSALTAISGTSLLTLQNATIVDNSTNAFTITNNGTVATTSGSISSSYIPIGNDYSGNTNGWTLNNINYTTSGTTYDAMTDVPTLTSATVANYAVGNPLYKGSSLTISNANLTMAGAGGTYNVGMSTISLKNGKYYCEYTVSSADGSTYIGICTASQSLGAGASSYLGNSGSQSYGYYEDGRKRFNATLSAYGASYTTGDIIGIAYDGTAGTLTYYKNGTSQGTAFTGIDTTVDWFFAVSLYAGNGSWNFGQRAFSYTPPTGYVALNTYNLPTSTIVKGNKYMDATVYTPPTNGNYTVTTTALNYSTNGGLIWEKRRNGAADNHFLVDTVRGISKYLNSNLTNAEATLATYITGTTSTGYTEGSSGYATSDNIVSWGWMAGGTATSNTSGSITSTVSVNTTAGFSIVTYTGTGANATVGHGLGVAPAMIIVKNRTSAVSWDVYHKSLGNGGGVFLNTTGAYFATAVMWNNTSPTSSVFSIGTGNDVNQNGNSLVAYCWAEIAGFSSFGSYTGNGSADGPFVFTNFAPKFVMFKRTDTISGWYIHDSTRNTSNVVNLRLLPNTSDAEATVTTLDFLSNGFKLRTSDVDRNASGGTYIYAAFAENPFKNALAR